VDKRTDIWAFGCVLYEMLTGKVTFRGETISDTIAAVLEREPNWQALPPETPAKIRDLLQRCLQKDSPRRLRDIGDARIEIEEAQAAPSAAEPAAATKSIRTSWRGVLLWGVAFLLLAAVTGIVIWNRKSPSAIISVPVSRIAITLPPDQPLAGLEIGTAVASLPMALVSFIPRTKGADSNFTFALWGAWKLSPFRVPKELSSLSSLPMVNGWRFLRTEN
jgi:serine/threonine protein kinase